ncbi:hypothetical protein DFH06DRAFT_1201664, partial [Mycena polygramma]
AISTPTNVQGPAQLELVVEARLVGLYSPPPPPGNALPSMAAAQPPADTIGFMTLLAGPVADINHYARQEHAKWLLEIAHDICDPRSMRGSLDVWDPQHQQWSPVLPTDTLISSTYCYNKSVTTTTGGGKTMRAEVLERDESCWVTSVDDPVINSHILPKRMGNHLAQDIFETFCGPLTPNSSMFDPIFGLLLSRVLNTYFNSYRLGFRAMAGGQYQCHSFAEEAPGRIVTLCGRMPAVQASTYPPLHGYPASPPHPHHSSIPPAGLFRWHYLQCVIRKFGHADYLNALNINYPELPVRMEDDSGSEGDTDSDADWPSASLDHGRALQHAQEQEIERHEAITEWAAAAAV